jgi:hypothetical protein
VFCCGDSHFSGRKQVRAEATGQNPITLVNHPIEAQYIVFIDLVLASLSLLARIYDSG